jgi:tRNA(Ile)-lysidine synthase
MRPSPELADRFRNGLDALIAPGEPVGLAVSGGPDSLALLLLVATARPGTVEAASVDHALRPESREEAAMVAAICDRLGVPHVILTANWPSLPTSAIQERARDMRYRLLAEWAGERGLRALLTAHHDGDQAETLLMRLARGAGVKGLAGIRPVARVPGTNLPLLRPLLGWTKGELVELCRAAGLSPAGDPSNEDEQFERVRVRGALAGAGWLDPEALARSAKHLAEADTALDWAAGQEWDRAVTVTEQEIAYRHGKAPPEIRRRIAARAILLLASEGGATELRGRELDEMLSALSAGRRGTLRGVLCEGGDAWRFVPAPHRTRRAKRPR